MWIGSPSELRHGHVVESKFGGSLTKRSSNIGRKAYLLLVNPEGLGKMTLPLSE